MRPPPAAGFARERRIPPDDRRLRRVNFLHGHLCTTPYLLARLLMLVPITAGVVVLMSFAPQPDRGTAT